MDNQSLLEYCKEYKEFADLEVENLVKKIEEFKPFIIAMDLLLKLLDDLESIESVYEKIDKINENKLKGKFTEFQKGLDAGRGQILADLKILTNKYRKIRDLDKLKKSGCIFCDQDEYDEDEEYTKENLIKDWWGNTGTDNDDVENEDTEELENEYILNEENIDYNDVITEE